MTYHTTFEPKFSTEHFLLKNYGCEFCIKLVISRKYLQEALRLSQT